MRTTGLLLFGSLIVCSPLALHAQRIGFSVGMPPAGAPPSAPPAQAHQPNLPPLPGPLPSPTTSTPGHLKPLDLVSMHLVPPHVDWNLILTGSPPPGILPQVPLPMDPILSGGPISTMLDKPAMCVQPGGRV